MEASTTASLSRRAVLAAAAGGSAVLVARSLATPSPSRADIAPMFTVNRVTLPAGAKSVTVAAGIDLRVPTAIVCSFMSDPGERRVTWVDADLESDTYTVHVNRRARTASEIGCVVTTAAGGTTSGPVSPPVSAGG